MSHPTIKTPWDPSKKKNTGFALFFFEMRNGSEYTETNPCQKKEM
jgi:hypothetical protein